MKKIIATLVAFSLPIVTFAQVSTPTANAKIVDVNSLATKLEQLGNLFTYLLVAAAVIFIIWNVVIYLIKGGEEGARSKAGMHILWGIVGLFVIISIWGLVNILLTTFGTVKPDTTVPYAEDVNNGYKQFVQ